MMGTFYGAGKSGREALGAESGEMSNGDAPRSFPFDYLRRYVSLSDTRFPTYR